MSAKFISMMILIAATPKNLLANGFVKEPGQYYTKLSRSVSDQNTNRNKVALNIKQNETATRLYLEYGLNLPWKSQLTVAAVHKTIDTKDNAQGDSFKTAGFGDSDLELKNQLGYTQIGHARLAFASSFGLKLGTTKEKFTHKNVGKRADQVPSDRKHLIAGLDNGTNGLLYGLGTSLIYKIMWVNLLQKTGNDLGGSWSSLQSSADLGFALPFNSWLQLGTQQYRYVGTSHSLIEADRTTTVTKSISLGLTFYEGLAAEFGYSSISDSSNFWKPHDQFEIGLSCRSI